MAGKQAKLDRANNIKEGAHDTEKEENNVIMMFAMMQHQHQDHINQMKDRKEHALEMAQQSMKQKAAHMELNIYEFSNLY